ncbi:MAG: cysteine peptidase family C39 domain-containing protein [Phycisphaerae bacterium]
MASRQIAGLVVGLVLIGGVVWYTGHAHPVATRAVFVDRTLRTSHLSCGPAALMAVVEAHDREAACRLRELLDGDEPANRPVSSLYELATWARRAGLRPVALKVDTRQLPRLPLPVIVHVSPDHFLALTAVSDDRVCVIDQGPMMREIPRRDFDRQFRGYVLCVQRIDAPFKRPSRGETTCHHRSAYSDP